MEKFAERCKNDIEKVASQCKLDQSKIANILEDVKKDKELMKTLHELGIIDEEIPSYLPLLLKYQENRESVKKDENALVMVLEISDAGKLTFHYEESKKNKEISKILSNYIICDYDDSFKTARVNSKGTSREKDFIKNIKMAIKEKKWLYVYGPSGSGKSYHIAAILNAMALSGKKVAFINANRRFEEFKNIAWDKKNDGLKRFNDIIDSLSKVEYLVLDDFGSEHKDEYIRDNVIFPLLKNRSKNKLFTAFTSDLTLEELEEVYNFKYGAAIYAEKLVSLIRENLKNSKEYALEKGLENLFSTR